MPKTKPLSSEEFHEKYDALVKDFFWGDDCDQEMWDEVKDHCDSEETLIRDLATYIFDGYGLRYNECDKRVANFEKGKRVKDIKKVFPELYKQSVEAFRNGDHDT